MKTIRLLLTLILSMTALSSFAQKIKEKTVDKFTNVETAETSTETLYSVNFMASGYTHQFEFSIRKIGDKYEMPANILLKDIEKYDENSGVVFLLENKETIKLLTSYTGIGASKFGLGYYFSTCFTLSDEDVSKLSKYKITDVRILYMGGHYDREIKKNKQDLVIRMLKLFE